MNAYQKLYKQLWDLIMAGKAFTPEADKIRLAMDHTHPREDLVPGGRKPDKQTAADALKWSWARPIGEQLYYERVGK